MHHGTGHVTGFCKNWNTEHHRSNRGLDFDLHRHSNMSRTQTILWIVTKFKFDWEWDLEAAKSRSVAPISPILGVFSIVYHPQNCSWFKDWRVACQSQLYGGRVNGLIIQHVKSCLSFT